MYGDPYWWGLFAFGATQKKRTHLTSRIIDVKNPSEMGLVVTAAESSGWYGFGVFLPIIVPAGTTESPACKRFGWELVRFILGETENKSVGDTP
jgi:hypothetical protein